MGEHRVTLSKIKNFILENQPTNQEIIDFINGVTIAVNNNETVYFQKGELHREDGPAIIYNDGKKYWCIKGELHREDGPAVEAKWYNSWYIRGELHREDGPAIEYIDGKKYWYLYGERLSETEFYERISI